MPGQITSLLKKYKTWLDSIDQAFDQVRTLNPGAIPCHAGCSQCCYSLFAIPVIDAFLIWEALKQKDSAVIKSVLNNCRSIFAEFKNSVCLDATIPFRVELVGWREFGIMVETFRRKCPFLTGDGWCGVYEWRPRICRLAGTVFKDPVTDVFLRDFCPLAEDARRKVGFKYGSFDIVGMDAGLMEFREEFQVVIRNEFGVELGSGHTFPVAGVLEAASRCFS